MLGRSRTLLLLIVLGEIERPNRILTRLQILAYVTSTWSFCSALTAASTRAAVSRFWRSHRGCSQPGCLFLSRRLMLDAHNLRCVFSHRFDQIHFLLDQFAVGDQMLHLSFFRYKFFPARIL